MIPFSFIRFSKRPPEKKPPPQNRIDVYWDEENSRLVAQLDDGTIIPVSNEGGASVSDAAYNEATWNGVTDTAPSKNAVRDKIELLAGTIIDPTALTFSGSDPNVPAPILVLGSLTSDGSTPIVFSELEYTASVSGRPQYESADSDTLVYDDFLSAWFLQHGSTGKPWYCISNDLVPSSDLVFIPYGSAGNTGAASLELEDSPVATHLGQWCKASTAWWQWDGSAWIPRFTLAGDPIAYNATLTAFRKLVVSGADGSEIITISAL